MKYGIITYQGIPNFGAVLQGYALCTALKKNGIDCEIIDYECENIVKRELTYHPQKNIVKDIICRIFIWPHMKKRIIACQEFEKLFHSKIHYTKNNIKQANLEYDGFISGSDMIWNLSVNGNDFSYFLDFVEDDKYRFSYGSSIGDQWKEKDYFRIQEYLSKYAHISVREEDTRRMIEKNFDMKCECVPDPTLLLSADEWKKKVNSVVEKNYVLVYFPYQNILNAAKKYAKRNKKKLVVLDIGIPIKNRDYKIIYSPEEFLSYIYYADAVFTDSYHGLLYSLYFHKPVWTNNHGNRILTILNKLNILNCFIDNDTKLENLIDYNEVDKRLQAIRAQGVEYLKQACKEKR